MSGHPERETYAAPREDHHMPRLTDNINSQYIEAANRLRPKSARRKIVAYVESYDDIFFWRTVLSPFENESRYFEVMLPSHKKLSRGKKQVLMNWLGERVGTNMIACVDADYDWLMQGATPMSKRILSSAYIFHTYAYAIENFQCLAESLHDVCVMATLNDHAVFDFPRFLSAYSEICFPLFVWSIWAYRTGNHTHFSITALSRACEVGQMKIANPDAALDHLRHKAEREVRRLCHLFPQKKEEVDAVRKDLLGMGVTPQTTYLYMQGHALMDNVVVPLLGKVCTHLRREREEEIRRTACHYTQMQNELASYQHSVQDITNMLRRNMGYRQAPVFLRLQEDIRRFLNKDAK